jgi:hypothetical protein
LSHLDSSLPVTPLRNSYPYIIRKGVICQHIFTTFRNYFYLHKWLRPRGYDRSHEVFF